MEKHPQLIKEFSKEASSEERAKTAEKIRMKRAEHFSAKRAENESSELAQMAIHDREHTLAEQIEDAEKLQNEIETLSSSLPGRLLNYFRLKKMRADALLGQKTYAELRQEQETAIHEASISSDRSRADSVSPELQEAMSILDNFYRDQREKWTRSPYTKEDIITHFSEERLTSLSLEDYALLLRRFPREMVTHVTRQGIRDHVGHMYHTAGEGAYANGFIKMIEDGRLRSPLGVYLIENEKEQAIARFLHLEDFDSKEKALENLAKILDERQGGPGSYTDKMAIHFTTEEVADTYYGSEKGNEIFIAYPSAYIASQYYFSGTLSEGGSGNHNDQWVWANEERGMDLQAGLVFIPRDAKVDRNTGSRYRLDENKSPTINEAYRAAFRRVVDAPDFYGFANRVINLSSNLIKFRHDPDLHLEAEEKEVLKKLEPAQQELEQKFGIVDKRLQHAIMDPATLWSLVVYKKSEDAGEKDVQTTDKILESALQEAGILWTEADGTIDSKEFWEAYFAKNPDKKPSKLVYYTGDDPTLALLRWRKEQGIHNKGVAHHLGFVEHQISRQEVQATAGLDRFKTLAEKVIGDYFIKKVSATKKKRGTSRRSNAHGNSF